MEEIANWWTALWKDPKLPATAIGGFIAAFLLFLIKDAFWQKRVTRNQRRRDLQQKRLDSFYAPLYLFYRESYARFDYWSRKNPDSKLEKRPFFQWNEAEDTVDKLLGEKSSCASSELVNLWTSFKAMDEKEDKNRVRTAFVEKLVKEYNSLRKELDLDYDQTELSSGKFS